MISSSRAPSNTGVATLVPGTASAPISCSRFFHSVSDPSIRQPDLATQPRCVSSTWPRFIRLGTQRIQHDVDQGAVLQGTACPRPAGSSR